MAKKAQSPWIIHVMAVKKQFKLKSLGEAMKRAKLTYKNGSPSKTSKARKSRKSHTKKNKTKKNKSRKSKK